MTDAKKTAISICINSRFTYNCWVNNHRPVGGAERDLTNVMRYLNEDGRFKFTLISETRGDKLPDDSIIDGVLIRNTGMPNFERVKTLRPLAYLVYALRLLCANMTVHTDIFFAEGCSVAMIMMWAAAKIRRKPCVFRYASISELDKEILNSTKNTHGKIATKLFDFAIRTMTQSIAQTTDQANLFEEKFGHQIPIIYNILNIEPLSEKELASSLAQRDNILWLGRCHSVKRPELFLKLAKALPQYRFVMVAPEAAGEEKFKTEIEQQAREIDNLTFIGGVEPDKVAQYYRSARVFIMTSVYEGFSNTMTEAFSQGTPVVAYSFAITGWLEPLNKNANMADLDVAGTIILTTPGYCCQGNDETFIEMTKRLMNNDDAWLQSANLALQYAHKMKPHTITDQYKSIFEKLA